MPPTSKASASKPPAILGKFFLKLLLGLTGSGVSSGTSVVGGGGGGGGVEAGGVSAGRVVGGGVSGGGVGIDPPGVETGCSKSLGNLGAPSSMLYLYPIFQCQATNY